LINCQKVEEQAKQLKLSIENKNKENERLKNELVKLREKNKSVSLKMQ